MEYLPAIYQDADPVHPQTFLGQFLLAFEKILVGLPGGSADARRVVPADTEIEGLGEKIARLHRIFDPFETPEDFLPWLAEWAALSLRADLSSTRKRNLLANIIPLYRIRGTRKYLEEVLTLCVDAIVSVTDVGIPAFQLEIHSTLGLDSYIGGGAPFFFSVTLVAPKLNEREKEAQLAIAKSVVELAKPAHTTYELFMASPRMEVGIQSTIGINTVLGPPTSEIGLKGSDHGS
jgi:phage tail-like protein